MDGSLIKIGAANGRAGRPAVPRVTVRFESAAAQEAMGPERWDDAKRILCWWMIQEFRRRQNGEERARPADGQTGP